MLLYGKPVAQKLKTQTAEYIQSHNLQGKYVAFLLLSESKPSHVYVRLKAKFAHDIGLGSEVVDEPAHSKDELIGRIEKLNNDDDCIGIVVQLPLPKHLEKHKAEILCSVTPQKDLDGLGGVLFGLASVGKINFTPATPKAVLEILDFYELNEYDGKIITILGQSNLIGKPLANEFMKRGATVFSFNELSDQAVMQDAAQLSDYLISATGQVGLVNENFLSMDSSSQVLIDVGRGIKDGKAVGDILWEKLEDRVTAVTPVPGGVGPVTVASLFHNLTLLGEMKR